MKSLLYVLIAILLGIVIYEFSVIENLNQEIKSLKVSVVTPKFQHQPIRFVKRDKERSKLFAYLHDLNQNQKKVRYSPGELMVEDIQLVQNDTFLDMLDYLFEADQLIKIELPAKSQEIREGLKLAGFSSDFITISKDGLWRVKIKQ